MTMQEFARALCYVVYALMTIVSIAVIAKLTTMSIKLIRNGADDKDILKSYHKSRRREERIAQKKAGKAFDWLVSFLLFVVFAGVFGFSVYVNLNEDVYFEDIPTVKIVQSDSMSEKNEKNTYLFENNLGNQFNTFDAVFVYKAPKAEDLQLYDIVVYELKGSYIIHRIVEIQAPTDNHPDEYWFKTQGDAVDHADYMVVKESQIKAIYRGERIPFIGSFVTFMQSPIGWMCLGLMFIATMVTPVIDKKLENERKKRLSVLRFEGAHRDGEKDEYGEYEEYGYSMPARPYGRRPITYGSRYDDDTRGRR